MRSTVGSSKGLAGLALGAALALALAGCGNSSGADETTLPGASQYLSAPCPSAGTKPADKEFTYWSMWTADEPQAKVVKHAIACFTKQTGVKVNVQWFGRKLLTQNVAPALNTNTVPDLFDQDLNQVRAAVVAPGGTQSVDDVLGLKVGEGDKTVKDVLAPSSYSMPQNRDAAGHHFEIPYELLSNAWWYNKDQVKDFQAPKTMNDLFALFDKAKTGGKAAISQDGDIDFYNSYFFSQLAEHYVGGGNVAKAAEDKTGQMWKTDPGFLKAAQLVQRFATGKYFINGWDASKFPQVQQRWADGESDYLFVGSWAPSETREYLSKEGSATKINYGSFQFPMPDSATHDIVEQLPVGFAVTAKAKHAEAAKAFIAYFLNKDILKGIPAVADNITPRSDLEVPSDLKDIKTVLDDQKKEHVIDMDGIDGLFGGKYVAEVFYPLDNNLLKGKITAEQFIDQMSSKTADYWKHQG